MKFLSIIKVLLILILPFLFFLIVFNLTSFDSSFYEDKFNEYSVTKNVPNAGLLHQKVIDFVMGKDNNLPNDFNEREKQHLIDVRQLIKVSKILLYIMIILFVLLLVLSSLILKINNHVINFVGKVLVFGGIFTLVLGTALFLLINSDFTAIFEDFHKLFFEKGTYTFDPSAEIIVKLYPEQLFMDLGLRISKYVFFAALIVILTGSYLILKCQNFPLIKN